MVRDFIIKKPIYPYVVDAQDDRTIISYFFPRTRRTVNFHSFIHSAKQKERGELIHQSESSIDELLSLYRLLKTNLTIYFRKSFGNLEKISILYINMFNKHFIKHQFSSVHQSSLIS